MNASTIAGYRFIHACGALAALCAPAMPAPAATPAASAVLEEVLVTAEKRTASAQKSALALTALTAEAMEERGVISSAALNDVVPGVKLGSSGIGTLQIAVRGIGSTNDTESGNPAVSFNIDGVYQARSRSALQLFYDLERVEVLRGPQGTLYGRNAIAGSINLVSRKPVQDFEAAAGVDVGNYSTLRSSAMVNLPLGETLALRAALQTERHDGYYDNAAIGATRNNYNDSDAVAGRVHLAYRPSGSASYLLTVDHLRQAGVGDVEAPLGNAYRSDPYRFGVSADGRQKIHNNGLTGSFEWQLGSMRLNYIGSAREDESHRLFGLADAPLSTIVPPCVAAAGNVGGCNAFTFVSREHSSSHELRLAAAAARLDWLLGAYHFDERNDVYQGIFPLTLAFIQPSVKERSSAAFGQATWSATERTRLTGGLRYTRDRKARRGGTYLFGQQYGETYVCPFGGGLNAPAFGAGGLPAFLIDPTTAGCLLSPNLADFSWNKTDWKLGYEFDLRPDSLLYFSVATGYKAGGYGDGVPPNNFDYGPENLLAYEAGSKNRLLDGRLQLNLAAFYYDYRDFQVSGIAIVGGQPTLATLNAQRARVYGLEAESIWLLGERDRISFDLAYLHARYRVFRLLGDEYHPRAASGAACALPGDRFPYCADYSGLPLAKAPSWSASLGYRHHWPLASGARLSLLADSHYESAQNLNYHHFAATAQSAFTRSNLALRYEAPGQRWSASAYVRNLEDDAVLVSGNPSTRATNIQTDGKLTGTGSYAAPRTLGFSVSAHY